MSTVYQRYLAQGGDPASWVPASERGYFITFEGSDGAGKSTQLELLQQALEKTGFKTVIFREPGSTEIGEKIRKITHDKEFKGVMCPETELLLVNASRAQLVREKIRPALEQGKIVICDRYYHSTIVYQGFGRGVNPQFIHASIQFAIDGTVPNVTFLLHLSEEEAERRIKDKQKDRFELEDKMFKKNIWFGIEWLKSAAQRSEGRLVDIDANNTIENIHNEIYRCCAARISGLPKAALDCDLIVKVENKII